LSDINVNRLTKEQALIISAYTGVTTGITLNDLALFAEQKLGKLVDPFEFKFANIWEELKEATRSDFIKLCYKREQRFCLNCGRELFAKDCWRCHKPEWRSA
jgi:hypothetical protein